MAIILAGGVDLHRESKNWTLFHLNTTLANTVRFLSRVSILTRDIDIAILSVRLSVRDVPVSDENDLTYRHSFFFNIRQPNHSSFTSIKQLHEIPTASQPAGALNTGVV